MPLAGSARSLPGPSQVPSLPPALHSPEPVFSPGFLKTSQANRAHLGAGRGSSWERQTSLRTITWERHQVSGRRQDLGDTPSQAGERMLSFCAPSGLPSGCLDLPKGLPEQTGPLASARWGQAERPALPHERQMRKLYLVATKSAFMSPSVVALPPEAFGQGRLPCPSLASAVGRGDVPAAGRDSGVRARGSHDALAQALCLPDAS